MLKDGETADAVEQILTGFIWSCAEAYTDEDDD